MLEELWGQPCWKQWKKLVSSVKVLPFWRGLQFVIPISGQKQEIWSVVSNWGLFHLSATGFEVLVDLWLKEFCVSVYQSCGSFRLPWRFMSPFLLSDYVLEGSQGTPFAGMLCYIFIYFLLRHGVRQLAYAIYFVLCLFIFRLYEYLFYSLEAFTFLKLLILLISYIFGHKRWILLWQDKISSRLPI